MPIDANVNDFPIVLDYRNRKFLCIRISHPIRLSFTNQHLFVSSASPRGDILLDDHYLVVFFLRVKLILC
jgi:hypothetical protein